MRAASAHLGELVHGSAHAGGVDLEADTSTSARARRNRVASSKAVTPLAP